MIEKEIKTVFNPSRYKFNDQLRECINEFQYRGFKVVVTYSANAKKYTAQVTAIKEIEEEQVSFI